MPRSGRNEARRVSHVVSSMVSYGAVPNMDFTTPPRAARTLGDRSHTLSSRAHKTGGSVYLVSRADGSASTFGVGGSIIWGRRPAK